MKSLIYALLAGVLLCSTAVAAPGQKHGGHKGGHDGDDTHAVVNVHFSIGEVRVMREYYAPRYRALPPGLQKKLYRTGHLPPGWEKRMEPIPVVVERQMVALPTGYQRGVIDGHAVVYNPRTKVIVDIAVLF
jgi:hypothetical protein